jgi:hypothetical protein
LQFGLANGRISFDIRQHVCAGEKTGKDHHRGLRLAIHICAFFLETSLAKPVFLYCRHHLPDIGRDLPAVFAAWSGWVAASLQRFPVSNREVRCLFVAISSVDHLTNTHRNRELCAIRKAHEYLFPELWVFDDEKFGYLLSDHFGEFKSCFRHCARP